MHNQIEPLAKHARCLCWRCRLSDCRLTAQIGVDDPGIAFNISSDKNILFSCIATSQDQAKANQYGDFSSMVNSCQAMQKYIQKTQELEFSVKTQADLRRLEMWKRQGRKVMKDTAKLRGVALPANQASIRGTGG